MPASDKSAAVRRGSKSRKRRASRKPANLLIILFGALLIAAGFFLQDVASFKPEGAVASSAESVHICEIMPLNKLSVVNASGDYDDWVELINDSEHEIDITGWGLYDDLKRPLGFKFPALKLSVGERVVVYCSGKLKAVAGYDFHAPFKLSAQGETLYLVDANDYLMDEITYPSMSANTVYQKDDRTGVWTVTPDYTPGMANTREAHSVYLKASAGIISDVSITEVMPDNRTYAKSQSGGYYDYIELYNSSDKRVSLAGWSLSDDDGRPIKSMLSDSASIGAGECLILYASGLPDTVPGEIHLSFRISSSGETIQLRDETGALVDSAVIPAMDADKSYSRLDSGFTADYPPTPGYANDQNGVNAVSNALDAQNSLGVYLNEAIASARKPNAKDSAYDWIELYNSTATEIDLSGYCLTDDAGNPHKWAFPQGTYISAGGYIVVYASGENRSNAAKGSYHSNFSLSQTQAEPVLLFSADGTLIDRLPATSPIASASFGRPAAQKGLYYMSTPTRGAANQSEYFLGQASNVEFATSGGYFTQGSATVSMTCAQGQTIRYTLDSSEPDAQSPEYISPFEVSETTIVRARAFSDGLMPGKVYTASFIFGEKRDLPVVSLVSPDDYLFGAERGIYSVGPKQLKYPYKGANFFKDWERAGNVEMFSSAGKTIISQGAGLQLQGQYSRMQDQKAFKVTARYTYSDYNNFDAKLFPNRDYTSVKSFILRASGQDSDYTRVRDMALTSLSNGLGVMYQDGFPVVVYVNGEYWGHYNLRERIHKYSIAQWENWTNVDAIDIIKGNSGVLQGSNDEYAEFLNWLKKNGCKTEENLARVEKTVDVENYLRYVAIEMYIGNTDLLNVKRYRSSEGDGKWRWVLYDTDWAFNTDTDSFRRWLDKDGAGSGKKTDNTLFVQLMRNTSIQDRFLKILSDVMTNYYPREKVISRIDEYADAIKSEMPMQVKKWGSTVKNWNAKIKEVKTYANSRAKKLLGYIKSDLGWSNAQMREYFSEIMDASGV